MELKVCANCGQEKEIRHFKKDKRLIGGAASICKKCNTVQTIAYYKIHRLVQSYHNIIYRCTNPNCREWHRYGGRGIKCLITKTELEALWLRDRAWLLKNPSIDRINNDGDYTYANCRFIEMAENSAKELRKAINQYDLNGKFIKRWDSISEAEHSFGVDKGNIWAVCAKKSGFLTAYKYKWSYAN